MIIGFDAKRAFHNGTGLGNYARVLLESLRRFYPEHRYVLYTPPGGRAWDPPPAGLAPREPGSSLGRAFPSLWRSLGISRRFDADGLNLFHGLSNELPFGREARRVRKVVTIHDLIFLRHPRFFSPIDRATYLLKTRHACRKADAIVAVSERTGRDLTELLGVEEKKIRVVYQSCHPSFFDGATPSDVEALRRRFALPERYLLCVGTIEERKNLGLIVEAMALGRWNIPLVVVGRRRPYFRKVLARVQALGLGGLFRTLDGVAARDLPALYAGAELFLYPSRYEGFGIPLLEAAACGAPVVAARGSCLEEAGGEQARYVDPDDPAELAAVVGQLLNDAPARARISRAGLAHVRRFLPERTAADLMDVYESLR